MKGMWFCVQGTCMAVTGTDSIGLSNPMPYTAAEGRSMLSRRDHHPWYLCIGRGWSAGLPQAGKAATALTALRAKKLRDSATLYSNEWDYKCTTHNTNLDPNMRAHY